MHKHSANDRERYGNPLYSWLSVSVFGVIAIGILLSLWSSRHDDRQLEADMAKWNSWPSTVGHPSQTRITERPLSEVMAKRNFRWYEGECLVNYTVTGKQYTVWGGAYDDSDRKWLADRMQTCPVSSYEVHYDPTQPWIAHAFIDRYAPLAKAAR